MRRLIFGAFILFLLTAFAGCAVPLHRLNGDQPTGSVVISCSPDNAKVFLDGIYVGKAKKFHENSPLKVTVGSHVVEFEADGYMIELREVVTAAADTTLNLDMQLRPVPKETREKKKKREWKWPPWPTEKPNPRR